MKPTATMPAGGLASLLAEAQRLAASVDSGEQARIAERLAHSVIRPLEAARGASADTAEAAVAEKGRLDQRLFKLAQRATRLRLRPEPSTALLEATAALHDLIANLAPARLPALARLQAKLSPTITIAANGPYLATNVALTDWLGVPLPARPQLALCRCGASKLKPLCDGSHVEVGFNDAKDPNRVAERRDSYAGQQLTVLDNRGLCAHSGFCTGRLANVFHLDSAPFVTPSGGRMDEIIRAVRACPSGALSYAIDDLEAWAQVDQAREPTIEVSKDGPYRVTGAVPLIDDAGQPVARNQGASLEHYSLCRCGKSQNKPFCSGMHRYANFRDPLPPSDREPSLFEWAGGFNALVRMTRRFYERYAPEEPLLAPLFASMSPDHPERVAAWLSEVFGGPPLYSERYGG